MSHQSRSTGVRTRLDAARSAVSGIMRSGYFLVVLAAYLLIAIIIFLYLRQAPVFSSEMALVLPGSGSSSNFSIEDVGQANAQTRSPFSGGGFNPRINYKEILKSRDVLHTASGQVGIDASQFGRPRVELTEQSSILSIMVAGRSADNAQQKAWALYSAFQNRLDQLRADETLRHSEGVGRALQQYAQVLSDKRLAVVEFQQRSMLISAAQMEQATRSLSALREKQMYALSALKSRENFVRQLSNDLGVSPELAGQAFLLNTDIQFRGYLRELDDSSAQISTFKSYWGANHPKVKAEQKRFQHVRQSLFSRSSVLVGEPVADLLHTMDLTVSAGRTQLFADLVDASAQLQADRAGLEAMELSQAQLQDRLKVYARESAELERLEREAKLAEAVYTSAAARLDAAKADVFASYPVIQMLTPPSSPVQQKSPKLSLAIAAGLAGFLFVNVGVLIVWQRHYLIKKLLKSG